MADIFISYARTDRARAETLARALTAHGWAVWWDREIPPGRTFDDVIEEALTDAKCVIVLWSRDSVQSEWVKTEASEAAKRRILVPILADEVKIPLEFRRIQSARLTDWDNLPGNPDWDQLNQALAGLVGRTPSASTSVPPPAKAVPPTAAKPATISRVAIGAVVAAVLLIVIAGRLDWQQESRGEPVTSKAPVVETASPDPSAPEPPPVATTSTAAPSPPVRVKEADVAKVVPPPRKEVIAPRPAAPLRPAVEREPDAVQASSAAAPIAPPAAIKPAERTPPGRVAEPSTFEVMHARGVFRSQGMLSVSPAGVRYEETGAGGGARVEFDVSCEEVRAIGRLNVIADREQRMVELGLRARAYTFVAAHTNARESIVSALSRHCGPR
jgi:hypothetical protein